MNYGIYLTSVDLFKVTNDFFARVVFDLDSLNKDMLVLQVHRKITKYSASEMEKLLKKFERPRDVLAMYKKASLRFMYLPQIVYFGDELPITPLQIEMQNLFVYEITKFLLETDFQYDDFTDEEKYFIQTPEQISRSRKQICYDMVEYLRDYFKKQNLTTKTYFICSRNNIKDYRTHTVIFVKNPTDNMWYWVEYSWGNHRGVYGPYQNPMAGVFSVVKMLRKDWKTERLLNVIEYGSFDYRGLNINQFGQKIIELNGEGTVV